MSILIINQGWTDNLGDKAIAEVLENALKGLSPLTVPFAPNLAADCSGIGKIIALYHLDRINRKDFTRYISELPEKPRAVVIGGGELFASNMNFNSAFTSWIRVCNRAQIPIYVYGVSGNKLNVLYSYRMKHALKKCKKIFVRDWITKKLFHECYKLEVEVYPDVVFTYSCEKNSNQKKITSEYSVFCNVLDYDYYNQVTSKNMSYEDYFNYWCSLIEAHLRQNTKVYVGTTTQEDVKTAKDFTTYIERQHPEWNAEFCQTDDLTAYWDILDRIDCVISARMHAMILAVQKRCYCVPVCFKTKLEEFEKEYHAYLIGEKSVDNIAQQALEGLMELYMEINKLCIHEQ